MVETKDKEIDGHKYTVTQFPAREGLKIKSKLVKVITPLLIPFLGGAKNLISSKFSEVDIDPSLLTHTVQLLLNHLSEDEVSNFVMRLLQCTRVDGKEITAELFDMEFAGEYITLYKVLYFVIEVNNFFGNAGTGGIMEILKKIDTKPESTGS